MKNEFILNEVDIEFNKERLISMAKYAKKRSDFLKTNLPKLNSIECYVRIAGSGFRAISLHNDSPLCEFKGAPYTKNIELLLEHANKPRSQVGKDNILEREIQCYLIKNALANKLDLKKILRIDDSIYDELLFALDEIVIAKKRRRKAPIDNTDTNKPKKEKNAMRCDILAVGVKDKLAFPVLIELKYKRKKEELGGQLDGFCAVIMKEKFRDKFAELLCNCVEREVNMSKIGKMIIWPATAPNSKPARNTLPDLKREGIDVIEYKDFVFTPIC